MMIPIRSSWIFALCIASLAQAAPAGLNLGWKGSVPGSDCPSLSPSFVCDRCDNTDSHVMVGSVVAPSGLTQVTGADFTIYVAFPNGPEPDFWLLGVGECRYGSLYVDAHFVRYSTTTCKIYWNQQSSGGFHWYDQSYWFPGPAGVCPVPTYATALRGVFAIPTQYATAMAAGTEYYLFEVWLDDLHAVPDPNDPTSPVCTGCQEPVCFEWPSVTLTQPIGVGDHVVSGASTRSYVSWQDPQYCSAVGARRTTWGQVRSLYR